MVRSHADNRKKTRNSLFINNQTITRSKKLETAVILLYRPLNRVGV